MQIGLDIIKIKRIAKSLENPRFLQRFFTEKERVEFKNHNFKVESIAGAYAAKEAFAKCIGTGIRSFNLNEINLLHNSLGAPYLELTGSAKQIADERNLKFGVSISHTNDIAAAVVIGTKT